MSVALVFPPHWYYAAVPGDLLVTGSYLRARGLEVRAYDLSAGLADQLVNLSKLRRTATYLSDAAYDAASDEVAEAFAAASEHFGVRYNLYRLEHPGVDVGHVPTALAVGLDPARNPALEYLQESVERILAEGPSLVAVALGHPDQLLQIPVLGHLLRAAGFRGTLALYGAHEDVVAPEDLAQDLVGDPPHALFEWYDAVVVGEAESALAALAAGETPPNVLRRGAAELPHGVAEEMADLPPPDYSLVEPGIYPYPRPLIDLRLSRSCPWGRCTFCAITTHQAGYRARPTEDVARDLADAWKQLGSTWFRFRDDLLTPAQLRELAAVVPSLPFKPRWSARARFDAGLTRETLAAAAAAGLEELWLGLESAVARVRNLMVKGVAQGVVERILADAAAVGIRTRVLCMVGYPGETLDEARATLDFIERHVDEIASVAITPFQLMRSAPLARGVEAPPRDPERLRFQLGGAPAAEAQMLLQEASERLRPRLERSTRGPSLAHAWIRASVQRA